MISREELAQEIQFRECVSDAIKIVQNKLIKREIQKLNEEIMFRRIIQDIILQEATKSPDKDPHPSTGINVLEDLLRKIMKTIKDDFLALTTGKEQRDSFRAHMIHAVADSLAPVSANEKAGQDQGLNEDVNIDILDKDEEEKFIDVDGDGVPDEEEEKDPREEFGLEGEDETGRNAAFDTFNNVGTQVVDAYSRLGNEEDRAVFYDYLITNLKLHFDKFERQLSSKLGEPTTDAYEQETSSQPEPEAEQPPAI